MDTTPRVLIVEDDPKLAALVRDYLARNGFEVDIEHRGDTSVDRIRHEQPDAVVLDLMLPGLDGLEVCRQVRQEYGGAILMLTARGEDVDEVVGLEIGADDYMAKPVRPRVLLARLRSLLRRTSDRPEPGRKVALGRLQMDPGSRSATWDGDTLDLTTAEYDLLYALAQRAGQVVDRDTLYGELRGIPWDGVDRSIDLRVSRLRKKLGEEGDTVVKSVRGAGYMVVAAP